MSHDTPAFLVIAEEQRMLRGCGSLAIALYFLCLKGHTDATGLVQDAYYRRFVNELKHRQSRLGGRRLDDPSITRVRNALERLEGAGLLHVDREAAKATTRLHIWLRFPGQVRA